MGVKIGNEKLKKVAKEYFDVTSKTSNRAKQMNDLNKIKVQ